MPFQFHPYPYSLPYTKPHSTLTLTTLTLLPAVAWMYYSETHDGLLSFTSVPHPHWLLYTIFRRWCCRQSRHTYPNNLKLLMPQWSNWIMHVICSNMQPATVGGLPSSWWVSAAYYLDLFCLLWWTRVLTSFLLVDLGAASEKGTEVIRWLRERPVAKHIKWCHETFQSGWGKGWIRDFWGENAYGCNSLACCLTKRRVEANCVDWYRWIFCFF